jgi:hypothetical protein
VWVASEDPEAQPLAFQCPGDHLRFVPLPNQTPTTAVKRASWTGTAKASSGAAPAKAKKSKAVAKANT